MKLSKLYKNRRVSDLFRLFSIGIALLAGIIFGIIFAILEIRNFKESSHQSREYFLELSKTSIKNEVDKVFDYVEMSRTNLEGHMRANIRNRVEEAWLLNQNIYEQNKNKLSKQQIKDLIKDALRPIRFFNNRGYFFIVSMNGVEELYPPMPHLEGENLLGLQDLAGDYVIQDEIDIVKKQGEGFVTDYWTKPDDDSGQAYMKTSFVKYFEPLDWYIGTGEYLDNFERDLQKDVVERIKQIRFGEEGYVFVNTYDFVAVVIDSPIYEAGDTLTGVKDPFGLDIMEAEKKLALTPGGGYFEYYWPRTGTDEMAPKISYVRGLDDWQWMIGAGVYTDTIDELIFAEQKRLNRYLLIQLITGLIVFVLVMIVVYFITGIISKQIQENFGTFTEKLRAGFWKGELLKEEDYTVKDIEDTISNINHLIISKLNADKQLQESETRFHTVFDSSPVMILILDEELTYITSNQELQKHFEIDENLNARKLHIKDLLITEKQNKRLWAMFKSAKGNFEEFSVRTINGLKTQNWAIFKTDFNEVIAVGYDITEIKDNQKRLKELNDTKDKFFSIVAHDLRSPFNSIVGLSELMVSEYDAFDDAKRKDIFRQIYDSSSSMYRMLSNLLNWALSQTGVMQVSMSNFTLQEVIDDVLMILAPQAIKKSILIENEIDHTINVFADRSMTTTVMQNLIGNGLKFTEPGGKIIIQSKLIETHVQVSVADTGIGIQEEVRKKIFMVSTEKSQKGTHDEVGTGLGLVVCKEFIEKMDGDIWVESEVGVGTTFKFTLPTTK